MFRFTHFRQAIAASKYSKTVLAVLLVGLLGSALIAANGLQPAGAAVSTLACSGPSTGVVNQNSTFTASGGNGTYSWSSAQRNDTGPTYTVAFPNPGQKTITLTSGTQSTTCSIYISSTGGGGGGGGGGSTAVSCSGPTTGAPGQNLVYTASGGNGTDHRSFPRRARRPRPPPLPRATAPRGSRRRGPRRGGPKREPGAPGRPRRRREPPRGAHLQRGAPRLSV